MFNAQDFVSCMRENLSTRGFGAQRVKEIVDDFEERTNAYTERGVNAAEASAMAMRDVFESITQNANEKARRTTKMLALHAENVARIEQAATVNTSLFLVDGKKGSRGTAIARAAVSVLEDDPRFKGLSYSTVKDTTRGQLYALFGETLNTIGKGAWGMQKGAAHLPNVIREVFGEATGDRAAADFATAWLKVSDLTVDLFNHAGGTMRRLERYLPQGQNAAKIAKAGKDDWVKFHADALDWTRTTWPDGTPIPTAERQGVLEKVFDTLSTNGANKIDATSFRGKGGALGNAVDNHRFMHYKDAQSWLDAHARYGDGNVFDVFVSHIEDMSHRIAVVDTLGPNPDLTRMNIENLVRSNAGKSSPKDVADADAILKNKFNPMYETIMRKNPMDPNSMFGVAVTGTSNILTSALLGAAPLLAIPGDFMQSVAVRALNNMGLFDGVGFYVKSLASDPTFMRQIATQSGFVMDQAVMATYSMTRWTGVATYGPAVTRHVSEAVMRASLMSGHTRSARWAVQAEFMGMLNRMKDTAFDELPFRAVMERYGIDASAWDAFRQNVKPWTPRSDVAFLRPIDALDSGVADAQTLYRLFQGMIFEETRKMVPDATIEGAVALKDTTRPDTLPGALLASFAMFKNFPISFAMIYGRLGMTAPTVKGRLAFYAGLGAGMTLVGAIGTQLREMSKGRDPLPMDTPQFLGKAFLAGGALSIWGDFLFTGLNAYGQGPQDVAGGPITSFVGDTLDLAFGDTYQWASMVGSLSDKEFKSTTAQRAVEWARRYTPGTSIWYARLALERQVWDRLQNLADPKAYQKRRNRVRKQEKDFGNEYFWAPGETSPSRAPQFGG